MADGPQKIEVYYLYYRIGRPGKVTHIYIGTGTTKAEARSIGRADARLKGRPLHRYLMRREAPLFPNER